MRVDQTYKEEELKMVEAIRDFRNRVEVFDWLRGNGYKVGITESPEIQCVLFSLS